jgi:hypothetical protein
MNQNARILEMIVQSQLLYQQNLERILHLISQQNSSTNIFDQLMSLINRELQRTPHMNNNDDNDNDNETNNNIRDLSGNNTHLDLSGNNTHSNHDDIVRNFNEFIGDNSMSDQFQIFLTNQINRATTSYNYSLSEPFTCPITLEDIRLGNPVLRINRCGHVFSQTALRRWFRSNNTCPVCRTEVL